MRQRLLDLGLAMLTATAQATGAAEPAGREAGLEDVARADPPAVILNEARGAPAGQLPIRLRIVDAPERIEPARCAAGEALTLERFIGIRQGETCGARLASAPLENSYWKLTRLGDAPVSVGARQREPHLILRPDERRLEGSGGCNRLTGSYRLDGNRLELSELASTNMACAQGMATEAAFTAALARVRTWRILGEQLELFAADGTLLAGLERRLMP